MTAILLAWVAEIVLEAIGAVLNFRRSRVLFSLLAFCALTDFAAVPLAQYYPKLVYGWIGWSQMAVKQLMLLWLACAICGMFVAERNKVQTIITAAFLSLAGGALVTVAFCTGETLKDRLLDGEIAANFLLLGMVALGWIGRRDRLSPAWKWITAGFMVMIGSDLACTALWTFWEGARHYYPVGAIAAQAIWCAGPLWPHKMRELRGSLGQRIPEGEKVSVC